MPTDLGDKARGRAQTTFNVVVLISFIICLVLLTLALLLYDQSFSKAVVELMSLF